jgi:hypothetical protein
MRRALAAGKNLVEQHIDGLERIARGVGTRRHALGRPAGIHRRHGRQLVELLEVVDDPVDHVIAEATQLVGREAEGRLGRG